MAFAPLPYLRVSPAIIAAFLASILLLLAPAIWNGFPLLFYDSGDYFLRTILGQLNNGRSVVYGAWMAGLQLPNFWPAAIAPFQVVVCPIGFDRIEAVRQAAQQLHDELAALGVDVVLDDRGERPGAMFADWELIGVPARVVVSERGLKAGTVEVQGRREAEARVMPLAEAAAAAKALLMA